MMTYKEVEVTFGSTLDVNMYSASGFGRYFSAEAALRPTQFAI